LNFLTFSGESEKVMVPEFKVAPGHLMSRMQTTGRLKNDVRFVGERVSKKVKKEKSEKITNEQS
jgi:hypothetical protein